MFVENEVAGEMVSGKMNDVEEDEWWKYHRVKPGGRIER